MRGRGRHHIWKGLAAGTAVLGLASIAYAQNSEAGKILRLTLGQSLQYSDNLDLVANPEGDALRSSTSLGLSYSDITRTQELRFSAGGAYEVDTEDQSDFSDPFANLSYALTGANSRLSFTADYRERDLDDAFVPLIIDFIEDQPVTEIARIEGGVRTNVNYGFTFETGLQSPIGFRLELTSRERRFADSLRGGLADSKTRRADILTTFRINPQVTARLTARARNFVAEDADQTDRLETSYGAGVALNITPATTLDMAIRQRKIETERTTGITETSGLSYDATLTRDLPNGNVGVSFASQPTLNGRDNTLRVNRSMALPGEARLSYGIGVSKTEGFSSEPLFSFAYARPLRNGDFEIELAQQARTDEDDDEAVIVTEVSANYRAQLTPKVSWRVSAAFGDVAERGVTGEDRRRFNINSNFTGRINDVSSWSLGAQLSDIRSSNPTSSERERRYGINMSYRREVARDWDMVASYRHSSVLDSDAADRKSNSISLGLERTFTVRP